MIQKNTARLACALAVCLPALAWAHDPWLLPSATVLSGQSPWVTVDAAIGNDKFYFDHNAMRLDDLGIQGPDGQPVQAENIAQGKLRSTFDVQLKQPGTYRIAVVNEGVAAFWKEDGKPKRYFGKPEGLAAALPAHAADLRVTQRQARTETFVTAGKPSPVAPVGKGLEIAAVTHPDDLYSGEAASFRLLLDGKPLADQEITVVPGGNRYRDKVGEIKAKTGADGGFKITWPTPGMYWMHADLADKNVTVPQATERRLAYSATVEVLQP
jgi:uncharacterized GH25 family protein